MGDFNIYETMSDSVFYESVIACLSNSYAMDCKCPLKGEAFCMSKLIVEARKRLSELSNEE